MAVSKILCVACRHDIDGAARTCPYCGADPRTGERIDTQAILQEVFRPREVTTGESVVEFARQRQGIVVTIVAVVGFLLLAVLYQFINRRNTDVTDTNAVSLTEVADLNNQPAETATMPMPDLKFQYDGRPQTMRTFIVEPGALVPPEVVAAQQAAAQEAAAKQAASQPGGPMRPPTPPPAAGQPLPIGTMPLNQPLPPTARPQPQPQPQNRPAPH